MRLILVFSGLLLCASSLMAETYSWTDQNGTMNFADDFSEVPKKYRKKVHTRGDINVHSAPAAKSHAGSAAKKNAAERSAEPEAAKAPVAEKDYGGKTLGDWRRELTAADAEVKKLDAKVKALDAQVRASGDYYVSRSQVELRQQYYDAVQEFNSAAARYNSMINAARSAGVPL